MGFQTEAGLFIPGHTREQDGSGRGRKHTKCKRVARRGHPPRGLAVLLSREASAGETGGFSPRPHQARRFHQAWGLAVVSLTHIESISLLPPARAPLRQCNIVASQAQDVAPDALFPCPAAHCSRWVPSVQPSISAGRPHPASPCCPASFLQQSSGPCPAQPPPMAPQCALKAARAAWLGVQGLPSTEPCLPL